MDRDLPGFYERDVFDEQTEHAFAFDRLDMIVAPHDSEVTG
ncbi:hypothetical protein [Paraburkholderia humisilvae]|nr:hypothetical protein [Paraburkholderia humisilvae]